MVVNAEAYYREMFGRRVSTWNLRDAYMAQTLSSLAAYRLRRGSSGRIVVWAHNSHLGDARATESQLRGEWNLGQLVRQQAGAQALLVGFTTYTGHVCAASEWDGDPEHKAVVPALHDSWEALFHSTGLDRFFLPLGPQASHPLFEVMLERAIGVLYMPPHGARQPLLRCLDRRPVRRPLPPGRDHRAGAAAARAAHTRAGQRPAALKRAPVSGRGRDPGACVASTCGPARQLP